MMLRTYLVYGLTFMTMFVLAKISQKRYFLKSKRNNTFLTFEIVFSILIFTLVFGLRYDVGVDYLNYLEAYKFCDVERYEPFSKFIIEGLSKNGFHYSFFFSLFSFLQITFFLYAFKDEKFLYPSLVFVLFCGQYFLLWMNVIRQDLAACIFIFSIAYIVENNFVKYLFWCIIAACFHKSAIALLLLYPVLCYGKDYFQGRVQSYIYLLCALLILFFQISVAGYFLDELYYLINYLGLESYYYIDLNDNFQARDFGFTLVSSVIIDIIIILYSVDLKKYYNSKKFIIIYNLFLFGEVLNVALMTSYILARPFRYFRYFKLIIAAYLLYYLLKNRYKNINMILFIVLVIIYLLMFIAIPFYSPESKYLYNFIM